MDGWNPGRNRWRYKAGSDEKIIEIELTQGKVAQIDADRLEEVQRHKWYVRHSYKGVYYAKTWAKKGGKSVTFDMHLYLFPNIIAPRDHIDRNGLNNIATNLRSGANGINERNRRSDKQDIGVRKMADRNAFRANWTDSVGKMHGKLFTWSRYSSVDDAYKAAVAWRTHHNQLAMTEIIEAHQNSRPIQSTAPPPPPPKPAHEGTICYLHKGGEFYRVKADIRIDGKRISKHFSVFQFENKEKATKAAKKWLDEMYDENQRKKRKIDDNIDE